MSGMRTSPVPKTIALGGVPTGIMNAQLAATVAGTSRALAGMPRTGARAARIGSMVATCAVFDVSPDMKTMIAMIASRTVQNGHPAKPVARLPM